MTLDPRIIKYNMKAMRTKAGLSQEDAALMLGITRQCISNYERRPESLSIKRFIDLARIYGCDPSYFFTD